ncbi:hypothetical protein BKA82DRAFT_26775 [Pisolithus tinctorius]|uniref:Uncharacterized protein n=1 Tax=Pisolithus tinctorius Marx 270 TaxID=870435 RepID=A0A0C3P8K8_PISTI|nr:hypothetical protein BKA82DRAFT_26775 [Pisolithus tinctorius]KIO03809.1 hypothetical protein M404DRAFT_26775 [Pisolithus tinctorius Marx 270]
MTSSSITGSSGSQKQCSQVATVADAMQEIKGFMTNMQETSDMALSKALATLKPASKSCDLDEAPDISIFRHQEWPIVFIVCIRIYIATKREIITNQLNHLWMDKIAQRIPNFLHSCKPPTIQFSKQARTTLPNLGEAVVEGHKKYLLELLDAVIKEKEKEEHQLQASLNMVAIVNHLYETIALVYDDLKSSSLIPHDTKRLLNEAMDEDAEPDLIPAPHIQAIYNSLIHKLPNLVARVIVLARARIITEEIKRKKKKELKDVAAATAGEFIPDKSSIAKMVAAQVKQQLNAKGPKPGKGAKGGKKRKGASGESKAKKKKSSKKNSNKQLKASDSKKAKSKKSKNAKHSKGKGKEKSS